MGNEWEHPKVRVKAINREQTMLRSVDVEEIIPADHPARAIWEITGKLDLSGYYRKIESVEGEAGRAAIIRGDHSDFDWSFSTTSNSSGSVPGGVVKIVASGPVSRYIRFMEATTEYEISYQWVIDANITQMDAERGTSRWQCLQIFASF